MGKKAFIYTRISQDRNAEGLGVQRQELVCREYAARLGLDVARVFSDNDVSAYSGRRRPEYREMLESLRAGQADAVICWRMDRLHRQPIELEEYAEVCSGGRLAAPILTYSVTAGGEIDLSTADGLLRAGIMGQVARFESATKRERAKAKAQQKAMAGEWHGGTRPFGWDIDGKHLTINSREAQALATAHHDVLAGRSLGSIIRDWNDPAREGGRLLTTVGKPWGYAQLRQALLRPRNAGLYEFHGEILSRDQVPAIVSEDIWRAVCKLLSAPGRRRSQTNKAVHLLAGIAQCHCGLPVRSATVYARPDKVTGERPKHTVYRCPAKGSGHVGKREAYVDAVVEMRVFRLLSEMHQAEAVDSEDMEKADRLRAELEALQLKEAEVGELLVYGTLLPSQVGAFNETIARRRQDLEEQMSSLGLQRVLGLDPLEKLDLEMASSHERFNAWLGLPLDDRREFIRSRFHVVLYSHKTGSSRVFDPDTVSVHPKTQENARRYLTTDEILRFPRWSIGQSSEATESLEQRREMLAKWMDSREGDVYDPALATSKRLRELAEKHTGLLPLLAR